jgi:DNA processing protein
MTLLFWQTLLAIDPAGKRFRDLIADLETSSLDPLSSLYSHPLFSAKDKAKLKRLDDSRLEKVQAAGVDVVMERDLGEWYRQTPGAPPALFHWGQPIPTSKPMIGIVGTRTASTYGKAAAAKFAEAFSMAGVVVVSGGALGIDAASHIGAVKGGEQTIAVLGTGVDRVYPAANRELFGQIKANGCLLSQFPVGTPSLNHNFPARNHTIAALCQTLLVVEAPGRSGALITAREAAESGREVFVVPGPINQQGFIGSHGLIRDGATLCDHPDQVLEHLHIEAVAQADTGSSNLTEAQEIILGKLDQNPTPSEKISESCGLDAAEVLAELTMLEMEGLIIRDAGGYALKP